MNHSQLFVDLWEFFRTKGLKTIELVTEEKAWEVKSTPQEFSVKDTFTHTIRAIYQDAGNWFLDDNTPFQPSDDPTKDLDRTINRMIEAIQGIKEEEFTHDFTFQWGEQTTIAKAIMQNLYHSIGHFAQIRERVGIYKRNKKENHV